MAAQQEEIHHSGVESSIRDVCEASNDNILHRVICDAGRWASGVVMTELWVLNDDHTRLVLPENGCWMEENFYQNHVCGGEECKLCQLVDPNHKHYVAPRPVAPGIGLVGTLWADTSGRHSVEEQTSPSNERRGFASDAFALAMSLSHRPGKFDFSNRRHPSITPNAVEPSGRHVLWRDVAALAGDPDQPWDKRLQLLAGTDIGWAAAIPFSIGGERGIVVYLVKEGMDFAVLRMPSNELYMRRATDLIASAYALQEPFRVMVEQQLHQNDHLASLPPLKQHSTVTLQELDLGEDSGSCPSGGAVQDDGIAQSFSTCMYCKDCCGGVTAAITSKVHTCVLKIKGPGVRPPPRFSWKQASFTSVGVFITLAMITRLNQHLRATFGPDHFILLGSIGAFMTLLFGLTSAPATQPRNAVLGQLVSILVGMAVNYLDAEPWFKQALGTALAVGVMVKCGITHPPAGGSAIMFSSGQLGWVSMVYILMATLMAVFSSTVINNLSSKRQYPTYWGLRTFAEFWKKSSLSIHQGSQDNQQDDDSEASVVSDSFPAWLQTSSNESLKPDIDP